VARQARGHQLKARPVKMVFIPFCRHSDHVHMSGKDVLFLWMDARLAASVCNISNISFPTTIHKKTSPPQTSLCH
jgi:hypothetical protein